MNAAAAVLRSTPRPSSPVLRLFELNPFRLLRLRVDATTDDAGFQAERALTLSRVGLSPEGPELLPWLPRPDPYELQQAAQAIEEPLVRLKHQMMWFDQVRDPQTSALEAGLHDPSGEILQRYLDLEMALPEVPEGGDAPPANHGAVAHAINQANIRLLAVAATLNGLQSGRADRVVAARPIAKNEWKELGGFRSLPQAHAVLLADQVAMVARFDLRGHWEEALQRWMHLLEHPWFASYLEVCIAALGDDFVTADDIETIQESIRMQLADISVRETRHLLLEGRFDPASALIAAIAGARMEPRVLTPAMQPLRQVFRSELAELEPLLEHPLDQNLGQIGRYLSRLEAIRNRWLALDSHAVIGLGDILDEAAEKAYLRLRQGAKPSEKTDALLARVGTIGSAQSLCERVAACRKEMSEARERICEFCKTEDPDYDKSVVLRGKLETGRDSGFTSTTVYYTIRYKLMLRCARCAKFHDFLRVAGILLNSLLIAAATLLLVDFEFTHDARGIFAATLIFGVVYFRVRSIVDPIIFYLNEGLAYCGRLPFAMLLTPNGHRRIGSFSGSKAAKELSGHQIKPDWRSDAVSFIESNKRRFDPAILVPAAALILGMLVPDIGKFLNLQKLRPGGYSPIDPYVLLAALSPALAIALGLWVAGFPIKRIFLATASIFVLLAVSNLLVELFFSLALGRASATYTIAMPLKGAISSFCVIGCLALFFETFRQHNYGLLFFAYWFGSLLISTLALHNAGLPRNSFNFFNNVVQIPAWVVLGIWMKNLVKQDTLNLPQEPTSGQVQTSAR